MKTAQDTLVGHSLHVGKGAVLSKSAGQKINTKSSPKTKLVGVDVLLPTVLWTTYFIEAQGHTIKHNIICTPRQCIYCLFVFNKKIFFVVVVYHVYVPPVRW